VKKEVNGFSPQNSTRRKSSQSQVESGVNKKDNTGNSPNGKRASGRSSVQGELKSVNLPVPVPEPAGQVSKKSDNLMQRHENPFCQISIVHKK